MAVSLPHFSCPSCLEYLCPRVLLSSKTLAINHVLTYLLTYLRYYVSVKKQKHI